jgi:tRNA(fMet)-specific endonuclease VapC
MARRVILDTGVLIAFERGTADIDGVLGPDDAAIAAITAMELLVGVERADEAHRQRRAIHVEAVLSSIPVVDYTVDVARVHARLTVAALKSGRPRSAYDMVIAATAAAEGRILLTTDASADFNGLPGVAVEVVKTTR